MALTDKLSAIGDAIREKTGGTELITLDNMPAEILAIQSGGGDELPTTVTGGCYWNYSGHWNWFIEAVPELTVEFANDISNMFNSAATLTDLSHVTVKQTTTTSSFPGSYTFSGCSKLTALPKFQFQGSLSNLNHFFSECRNLVEIPEYFFAGVDDEGNWDTDGGLHLLIALPIGNMFKHCQRLRKLPNFIPTTTNTGGLSSTFFGCYSLDEVLVPVINATLTSNKHASAFGYLLRAKKIVFNTQDDGTPYAVSWKSQTIDLSSYVGYSNSMMTAYGFSTTTEVTDATTYAALVDNEDYWTRDVAYSRYNHDSAVETINSLPDVTSSGGTNTIKFMGESGSATTAGAISTLTEEEIAVATAKGWTVTLV